MLRNLDFVVVTLALVDIIALAFAASAFARLIF